jgi:predicted CXXCH cytochrome family protein
MAELRDTSGPTCASCHGSAHTVRPIREWTDQERVKVCAGCHPGAGTGFLQALSHQAPSPSFLASAYFAGRFLVILASASLAFGIIHVELDLLRWLVRRWRAGSGRRARWESS